MRKVCDVGHKNIGQRFGRWVVLSYKPKGKRLCKCDCGTSRIVRFGTSKSCGCLVVELLIAKPRRTTHGKSKTRVYKCWKGMLSRCRNFNNADFNLYGGRGITVCERWHAFENFYEDMGDLPKGLTLGRMDSNGNYEPRNCRWETWVQQARNTKRNHVVEANGIRRTLSEWSEMRGIQATTIRHRLKLGWSAEKAITTNLRGAS